MTSCLLPRWQGRSGSGTVVQNPPRFGWGRRRCPLPDGTRSRTTWRHDHLWKMWGPRGFSPVHRGIAPGLGGCRESRSSKTRSHCDILRWSPEGKESLGRVHLAVGMGGGDTGGDGTGGGGVFATGGGGGLATSCVSCCSYVVKVASAVLMLFSETFCLSVSS